MRRIEIIRPLLWSAVFCLFALIMRVIDIKPFIAAAALSAAFLFSLLFTRRSLLPLLLALLLSLGMTARYAAVESYAHKLALKYDGVKTRLFGEVYSVPEYSAYSSSAILKTELGFIRLTFYNDTLADLSMGDKITLNARLYPPKKQNNDYAFNSRNYFYSQKIYLCADGLDIPRITGKAKPSLRSRAAEVREKCIKTGEKYLGGPVLALYCAVTFGDKSHMNAKLKHDLSVAGLSHIAAVSGTHLSVVAAVIMFLITLLLGKGRISRLAAIAAVIGFALLTGGSVSVIRACITNVIYQLARIVYRDSDGLSSLSAAFIIMCFFNPMIIYSPAFLLSVSATLGILMFAPIMTGFINKTVPKLRIPLSAAAVCLSAQLTTFPLLAYFYKSVSVYALVSNTLTTAFLPLIMPCGLLLPLLGNVPFVGYALAKLCSVLYGYIAFVSEKTAALPFSTLAVGGLTLPVLAAYLAAVFALFALMKKHKITGIALCGLAIILTSFGCVQYYERGKYSEVCFLNVGRGDCTYFNLHNRTSVLVDGGRKGDVIENYLAARGKTNLDCAIVTSAETEHLNGVLALAADGMICRLYLPAAFKKSPRLTALENVALSTGCSVTWYKTGDSIYIDGLILTPIEHGETSVQLLARCEGANVLLCGDEYMNWTSCDILKAPNHGKGNYNYVHEINKYKPRYAVVTASGSSAADKSSCVRQLKSVGAKLYVPAVCGTVTFTLQGGEIKVRTTN